MKITKNQLKHIIKEELEAVIGEAGFFKRLGAELTGQRKKTSKVASAISQWMRENDLVGKFGPLGTSGTGTRSGKGWENQNDVFEWASDNVEEAKALAMAIGEHGHVKKGFENDPRVKAAREFHDVPRDAELARSKERQDAYDAEMKQMATNRFNRKAREEREATAAAKKKEEEEMKSFKINQAGREAQKARDERDYQERLRQKQRDSARYGPQDYDVVRKVRENRKITKSKLLKIIKEELKHVLNEREGLGAGVPQLVELTIAAINALQEVGGDMAQYKEWAATNLNDGSGALQNMIRAEEASEVIKAAWMNYKHWTHGIDFEYFQDRADAGGDNVDPDIKVTLQAKPLLDKLAAVLNNL